MRRALAHIGATKSSLSWCTEYQAVLDYAQAQGITQPSQAQSTINNAIIENLKTEGVWGEFDLFYYFKQEAGLSDFARINWDDPSKYYLYNDAGSLPTFIPNSGFHSYIDGVNRGYFKTGYTPTLNAVKALLNNVSIIMKPFGIQAAFTIPEHMFGARVGNDTRQTLIARNTRTKVLYRLYGIGGNPTVTLEDMERHCLIDEYPKGDRIYYNDILKSSTGHYSGDLTQLELGILCFNSNGSFSSTGNVGLEYLMLGASVRAKQSEIYNILNGTY